MSNIERKADCLNRQEFIDTLTRIVRNLSSSGQGCTFAINGKWGCGKTYVLDMFAEQISVFQHPEAAGDYYAVFRYNCWEYDYYEEPVLAIIAAIRDELDKYKSVLPKIPMLKPVLETLKEFGTEFVCNIVKQEMGFNPRRFMDIFTEKRKQSANDEVSAHDYDSYYSFKTVLEKTQKSLAEIAQIKPVVILIDELDRCIPEYAIKVLERLHHLFHDQNNIIVILAIDSDRLSDSIKSIYGMSGENGSARQSAYDYLKKFISFSLKLDVSTPDENFFCKYQDYFSCFGLTKDSFSGSTHELLINLTKGLDIRTQEKIMDRTILLHQLAFPSSLSLNESVLYFELMHQFLTYRCPSPNFESWLFNASHIPEVEDALGSSLYEYILLLRKNATYGMPDIVLPSYLPPEKRPQVSLRTGDIAGAFWYFYSICTAHDAPVSYYCISPLSSHFYSRDGDQPSLSDCISQFDSIASQMEYK